MTDAHLETDTGTGAAPGATCNRRKRCIVPHNTDSPSR